MLKPTARRTLMTLFLSVFAAVAVQALAAQPLRADSFSAWVSQLWPEAEAAGVSKSTFDRVFSGLKPNCKLPGVYCPGERKKPAGRKLSERTGLPEACNKITQPEFLKPEKYFPEGYMRNLALRGRKILNDLEAEGPETLRHLKEIERSFRVSRNMLMGLWGRETAFGRAKLNYNGFRSLASYAWAGYKSRQGWSREQLIAALIMVERGHMTPGQFKSSYAGATGLTQIMPDEFVGFAVDGDQDGKKDIWNSIPDAMATTANVLKDRGWHSAPRSWGYEIKLPEPSETFDCTMEKRANRFPIGDWRDRFGIARVPRLGREQPPFPEPGNTGYLVLPAGARGPAFLVTENFDVLRSYNTADTYALFVGHLADRVGCDTKNRRCKFYTPWPKSSSDDFDFSVENLCRLQLALKEQGHLEGIADGLFGVQTRVAIGRYQKATGRKPDCYPSRSLFRELTGSKRSQAEPGKAPG